MKFTFSLKLLGSGVKVKGLAETVLNPLPEQASIALASGFGGVRRSCDLSRFTGILNKDGDPRIIMLVRDERPGMGCGDSRKSLKKAMEQFRRFISEARKAISE